MILEFDIFEVLQDGAAIWHRAAATLAEGQQLARQLALKSQNSFFILSQTTGRKYPVSAQAPRPDDPSEVRQSL
ncbi:MAG: hypothetical protein ABSG16_14115 [Candidatus Acidiferrum sp.]|jgi:hypothetical protein